jgi:heme O synthase-like polyprenyltransferase
MDSVNYTYIPVSIAVLSQILFPYMRNLHFIDIWIVPHFYIFSLIFLASYILFGITLWKSREVNNEQLFVITWFLVFLNLIWIYTFKSNRKISLLALFGCLLLGYCNYNALFLSELSANENTLYINLYATYLVFIGFTITILIESSPRKIIRSMRKGS